MSGLSEYMTDETVVYSRPSGCRQCIFTKKLLDKRGISYRLENLEDFPELVAAFKAKGHAEAPIVTTKTGYWTGFNPKEINALANAWPEEEAAA